MTTLAGKWALVTGASKGFGNVLAEHFAEAGMHLLLSARDAELLGQTKQRVERRGVQCRVVAGDITDDGVLGALVEAALEVEVEIVVNNAGIVIIETLEDHTLEQVEKEIALNLVVPIKLTRALIPFFKARNSGTIVNVNSAGGKKPVPDHTVYCATKYGLNGFAEALKLEVKEHGIRVMNVSPGKMATDLFRAAGKDWDTSEFIPPEEVARAVVSLLQLSPRCCPAEIAIERMK